MQQFDWITTEQRLAHSVLRTVVILFGLVLTSWSIFIVVFVTVTSPLSVVGLSSIVIIVSAITAVFTFSVYSERTRTKMSDREKAAAIDKAKREKAAAIVREILEGVDRRAASQPFPKSTQDSNTQMPKHEMDDDILRETQENEARATRIAQNRTRDSENT
jgi:hypothetical protein